MILDIYSKKHEYLKIASHYFKRKEDAEDAVSAMLLSSISDNIQCNNVHVYMKNRLNLFCLQYTVDRKSDKQHRLFLTNIRNKGRVDIDMVPLESSVTTESESYKNELLINILKDKANFLPQKQKEALFLFHTDHGLKDNDPKYQTLKTNYRLARIKIQKMVEEDIKNGII